MEPKLECGKYSPAITLPHATASATKKLPEELTNEILSRLPIGPHIGRFRCVCKSWRRLFSDSSFLWQLLLSSSAGEDADDSHPQIMVSSNDDRLGSVYSLHCLDTLKPLLPSPIRLPGSEGDSVCYDLEAVGCCNGLVCVSDLRQERLTLWNPATSETKVLPRCLSHYDFDRDDDTYPQAFGFGFDSEANDYKVVSQLEQVSFPDGKPRVRFFLEVYSLRNDSWRKIGNADRPYLRSDKIPQLHKGKLYWWRSAFDAFDISTEEFQTVELKYPEDMSRTGTISECLMNEESMVVLCSIYDRNLKRTTSCGIWVLLKYWESESWTKLLVIDVEPPPEMKIFKGNVPYPLGNFIGSIGLSGNLKCFFMAKLISDDLRLEEEGESECSIVFHPDSVSFSHLPFQGRTLDRMITNYVPSQVSPQDFI